MKTHILRSLCLFSLVTTTAFASEEENVVQKLFAAHHPLVQGVVKQERERDTKRLLARHLREFILHAKGVDFMGSGELTDRSRSLYQGFLAALLFAHMLWDDIENTSDARREVERLKRHRSYLDRAERFLQGYITLSSAKIFNERLLVPLDLHPADYLTKLQTNNAMRLAKVKEKQRDCGPSGSQEGSDEA